MAVTAAAVVRQRPERLTPRWRQLLLTVHVVTTVSAIGVDLVLVALLIAGRRGTDPRTVYPAADLIANWLVAPLAGAAIATGVLLGVLTSWGVFRHWWVTVKLVITVLLTALVLLVLTRTLGVAADAATGGSAQPLTDTMQTRLVIFPSVGLALLTVNAVLGMYKPGRRIRRRRGGSR